MLITKSEFREKFGYRDASSVSHLLSGGSIVANDDGKIDTEHPVNSKFIRLRTKKLKKNLIKEMEQIDESESIQLSLKSEFGQQQLLEKKNKNALLQLKIAKEQGNLIEVDVLNKVISTIFGVLFKQLSEVPSNIVEQVIDYAKVEKEPKEMILRLMNDSLNSTVQNGLKLAKKTVQKYYDNTDKSETN